MLKGLFSPPSLCTPPPAFNSRTFSLFLGGAFPLLPLHTCRTHNCWGPRWVAAPHRRTTTTCTWGSSQRDLPAPGKVGTRSLESQLPSFSLYQGMVLLFYHLSLPAFSASYKGRTGASFKKPQGVFKSDTNFLGFSIGLLSLNLHHLHRLHLHHLHNLN